MNSVKSSARAPRGITPRALPSIVRLALWSALVAGIGELALRLVARRFLPEPVFINPASVWLGPLSALLVFTPVIILGWLVGRIRGPRAAWIAAVAVAAFVASLDVLMLIPRLHLVALVVLAAGVASQVAWVARRWPTLFARMVATSTAALALVAGVGGMAAARGDRGLQLAGGVAPADGEPSVLLLVLDTVRALELSAYDYQRPTSPQLAALAREGVRFERAVASAPWTLPTHATLFTGLFQRDLSVGWSTALDRAQPTLAEHFSSRGYATGGFVANLRYVSREYGLARGFQTYRDYALVGSQLVGSTMIGRRLIGAYNDLFGRNVIVGRKDAQLVVDEFLEWQDQLGDRPYFAFLNFFDAHEPYAPEAPYDLLFASEQPASRSLYLERRQTPAEVRGLRDAYDGSIASLDAQLGRLFESLRRRGTLDKTIVVVTADHGEEFAEHGLVSHGNGLHFPALHVPLVVRWPNGGVPRDRTVLEPVSLADVPATILDLAGKGVRSPFPGKSLAPLWHGERPTAGYRPIISELYWVPNQPAWYPVSGGNMRSLVRGRYHYIAGPGAREELYDIVTDPFEHRDLAPVAALADTLDALQRALAPYPAPDRQGR